MNEKNCGLGAYNLLVKKHNIVIYNIHYIILQMSQQDNKDFKQYKFNQLEIQFSKKREK